MYSTTSQSTTLRQLPSYSPDTDETLRLATQKLNQAPQHYHQVQQYAQQQQAPGIPHAYVIPIPLMPDNHQQQTQQQHTYQHLSTDLQESVGSCSNGQTTTGTTNSSSSSTAVMHDAMYAGVQSHYQFAPIIPDATNSASHGHYQFAPILLDGNTGTPSSMTNTGMSSGAIVTPTPISMSARPPVPYLQYHEAPPGIANYPTFGYSSHPGFFLPTGYRLVYEPTGTSQSQPATPAAAHLSNSHDGTPPGETQHPENSSQQD